MIHVAPPEYIDVCTAMHAAIEAESRHEEIFIQHPRDKREDKYQCSTCGDTWPARNEHNEIAKPTGCPHCGPFESPADSSSWASQELSRLKERENEKARQHAASNPTPPAAIARFRVRFCCHNCGGTMSEYAGLRAQYAGCPNCGSLSVEPMSESAKEIHEGKRIEAIR